MTGQSFTVEVFAIRLAVLPATKQNANPLESQSPHDRISRLALGALLLVIGPGPGRGADGMCRPLMKRLANKLRTRPAPMHPTLLPATRLCRLICIPPNRALATVFRFTFVSIGREHPL